MKGARLGLPARLGLRVLQELRARHCCALFERLATRRAAPPSATRTKICSSPIAALQGIPRSTQRKDRPRAAPAQQPTVQSSPPAPKTFHITNGWSSMGFGLPGAIAAKLARPDLPVVCVLGDGCFQMTCGEVATAKRLGITLPVVVLDDRWLALIKVKQIRRQFPLYGTELQAEDYRAPPAHYFRQRSSARGQMQKFPTIGKFHRWALPLVRHSITSSARGGSVGRTSRPSAFAVVRLMTRSNPVGCSTGIFRLPAARILST